MNRFSNIFFYLPLLAMGCSQSSPGTSYDDDDLDEKVEQNTDSTLDRSEKYAFENLKIEFHEAIALNSTPNIAIPLIYDETERDKMEYDRTFFNLAVFTDTSEKPIMAFPGPVMINEISTIEAQKESLEKHMDDSYYDEGDDEKPLIRKTAFDGLIFLETSVAISEDEHQVNLWIYDLKNLELIQLNPDFTSVSNWNAIENSGKVLVYYTIDSNGDKLLNEDDDENMSIYDVTNHTNSGSVFDLEMLKDMKSQVVKSH